MLKKQHKMTLLKNAPPPPQALAISESREINVPVFGHVVIEA